MSLADPLAPEPRSRITGERQRERILAAVQADPGMPVGTLQVQVGLGWGALYHHLLRLSKEGRLAVIRAGRRRLVYPACGGRARELADGDSLLKGRTARDVAEAIHARPGCAIADLVEAVGLTQRVVYYHVRRLIGAGLVESGSQTRRRGLRATPRLEAVLAPEPSSPALALAAA